MLAADLRNGPILATRSPLETLALRGLRERSGLDDLLAALLAIAAVGPLGTILPLVAIGSVRTVLSIATVGTFLALDARFHRLLACADRFALVGEIVVAIIVELVALAARLLVLEPAALVGDDAEIMVGELEIGLGADPVALALRVGGEVLVLLEQLRRVAARAIVDAVAVVGAALTLATAATALIAASTTGATTAATATGLTVVDQAVGSLPRYQSCSST